MLNEEIKKLKWVANVMLLICVHDIFVSMSFKHVSVSVFTRSNAKAVAELPLGGAIGTGTKPAVFSLIT